MDKMKVFLHDHQKGRYYAGTNKWVIESKDGLDFESIEQALVTRNHENLESADVVVISENPGLVVRLTGKDGQRVTKVPGP